MNDINFAILKYLNCIYVDKFVHVMLLYKFSPMIRRQTHVFSPSLLYWILFELVIHSVVELLGSVV